jgi:hypothetical protein
MGTITLTCTTSVTNIWFYVSNILGGGELQMELLLHYIIFNVYIYVESLKSIQWMKNTQKHVENIITNVFK